MSASYSEQRIALPNDPERVRAVRDEFARALDAYGYSRASAFAVQLAFEEAVSNGLRHGGGRSPGATIDVAWRIAPDEVRIVVEDHGPGFDPSTLPDCTSEEHLGMISGRGVMLMRAYMTRVEFNETGNRVTMVYERK